MVNDTISTRFAKSCPTLLWSHGPEPSRLLRLWDFLGRISGVTHHFLLHMVIEMMANRQWAIACGPWVRKLKNKARVWCFWPSVCEDTVTIYGNEYAKGRNGLFVSFILCGVEIRSSILDIWDPHYVDRIIKLVEVQANLELRLSSELVI